MTFDIKILIMTQKVEARNAVFPSYYYTTQAISVKSIVQTENNKNTPTSFPSSSKIWLSEDALQLSLVMRISYGESEVFARKQIQIDSKQ